MQTGHDFLTVSRMAAVRGQVYWCMSVGFTCRSVMSVPFSSFTVTSRNVTLSLDHSAVNLMVGWAWLILSTKFFRASSPWLHRVNTSSIYLHQTSGFSEVLARSLSSKYPMSEDVCIGGGHPCSHGWAVDLQIVLIVKHKVVFHQDLFDQFCEVFCWWLLDGSSVQGSSASFNSFTVREVCVQ